MRDQRSTVDRVHDAIVGVLATAAVLSQFAPQSETTASAIPSDSNLFSISRPSSRINSSDDLALIIDGRVVHIQFEPTNVTTARGEFAEALRGEDFSTTQDAIRQILNNHKQL